MLTPFFSCFPKNVCLVPFTTADCRVEINSRNPCYTAGQTKQALRPKSLENNEVQRRKGSITGGTKNKMPHYQWSSLSSLRHPCTIQRSSACHHYPDVNFEVQQKCQIHTPSSKIKRCFKLRNPLWFFSQLKKNRKKPISRQKWVKKN